MKTVIEHRIEFCCPGTFVSEQVDRVVAGDELNITHAVALAESISARYDAKPYGFHFVTETHDEVEKGGKTLKSDPEITRSGCHYLDGEVLTMDDIPDTDENEILRSNMRCNDWKTVVRTRNSYKHTGVLEPKDVVLQGTQIVARGADYCEEG